jgi:hypothetical protein
MLLLCLLQLLQSYIWDEPTVSDNNVDVVVLTFTSTSGDALLVGSTVVTYFADDGFSVSNCSFEVFVEHACASNQQSMYK